jgi:predicted hydrocarbon binding protein
MSTTVDASATVDSLLPLSFLQAVRRVDTPDDDEEAEYASELRNKRLGLSETVYAQIRRYSDAVKRHQRSGQDEAVALARLIGRRPDAEHIFREAGAYLAGEAYLIIPVMSRQVMRALPSFLGRPRALRRIQRIARRYLHGEVRRVGSSLLLDVPESVTLDSAPNGKGCAFYEACLRELVRLTTGVDAVVDHIRCARRIEGVCEWRIDWR